MATNWFITNHGNHINVSTLHFTWPALTAQLDTLGGTDHSSHLSFPADVRDQVAHLIDTTERIARYDRDAETAAAAAVGLAREDDQPRHASHPLGHRTSTVQGATVYDSHLGEGTVTIYDES